MSRQTISPGRNGFARCLVLLAVLACAARHETQAHDFCVESAQQLQDALDAVSDGGAWVDEDNLITIVRGTYATGTATGNAAFHSNASTTTHGLTIYGGFSPGCSGERHPASSTILDGHGISGVMTLRRPNGHIGVTHLTFRNGEGDLGAGLQVNHLASVNADVSLSDLIFLDNHASASAGGLYASGTNQPGYIAVYLANLLFSGNRADDNYGAAYITAYNELALVKHTTIHDNHAPAGATGGLYCGGNATCQVEETIAWANTHAGIEFDAPINALICSDVGTLAGATPDYSADNLSVAPSFVDAAGGDYHLSGDSPLLARCQGNPFQTDLDDRSYPARGGTDMGAYEETILQAGFEGG